MKLWLAGDVMTGRGIDQILRHSVEPTLYESYVKDARGYLEIAEEAGASIPREAAPGYIWGDALGILDQLDPELRIINLETAVTTAADPWPDKGIHYRMHPGNVDVLQAAGVDCCVLANNHVLDWGRDGLNETLQTLQSAGIGLCGAGRDSAAASAPAVFSLDARRRLLVFGMADGSSGVPDDWAAGLDRSGVRLLGDLSSDTARRVARDIAAVRRPGDRIVASIHWGGNWGYDIPDVHRAFAHRLIEEGEVDIVHGHSSHHPKGIEIHHGRLILYGCGDLINDYEGIGGHERYRPELTALYLPRMDAENGHFQSMTIVPMRIEAFRLNRAGEEETTWLADRLRRESPGVEIRQADGGCLHLAAAN